MSVLLKCSMCVSAAQTLTTGLAEQVERERVRLEVEIKQASDKALHAVHKWYGHNCQQMLKCCNEDVFPVCKYETSDSVDCILLTIKHRPVPEF